MDSPFMEQFATLIAERGLRVLRFELPYMAEMRRTGRRRPPDPEPRLRAAWHAMLDRLPDLGLPPGGILIGGKSLGGRIASLIAAERPVSGLVCLGYPFHPPGRPERTRIAHLQALAVPTLICQGTRDPFGLPAEMSGYALSPAIGIRWIPDGEHSFKPRPASGRTWAENLALAADGIAAFVRDLEGAVESTA
jgi:predicted alpha/beta-hydrolase family hydrolase